MDSNTRPDNLLKELKKLRSGQESVEKELITDHFLKKNGAVAEMKDLEAAFRKDSDDFRLEKSKIASKLSRIHGSISYFRSAAEEAKDPKNKKTTVVIEAVKKAMEEVEALISSFKESQSTRFNDLAAEEKYLEQDVTAVDRKIELWLRQNANDDDERATRPSKVPVSMEHDITKDLPPEIAQFQRFVDETGGHAGSWDKEDHELFLRNWSDMKSDAELVGMLSSILPTQTETEIRDHVRWYRQYLALLSTKKDAIARWKEDRKLQQKVKLQSGKTREQEMAEEANAKRIAIEEQLEADRRLRKQQLNAWRVDRELERLKAEEAKTREEIEREIKAERDQIRHLEVKEKVKQIQEEKQRQSEMEKRLAEEEKRLEEAARRARVEANRPNVELRNIVLMEEKLQRDRQRQIEKAERQLRLQLAAEKLKPKVASDPNRVLQPTKGWQHRVRSAEPSVNRNVPPNFANIPHRAVPTWRQGPV